MAKLDECITKGLRVGDPRVRTMFCARHDAGLLGSRWAGADPAENEADDPPATGRHCESLMRQDRADESVDGRIGSPSRRAPGLAR
jgi:hypothetical protein